MCHLSTKSRTMICYIPKFISDHRLTFSSPRLVKTQLQFAKHVLTWYIHRYTALNQV